MPAFNEEASIEHVVREWFEAIARETQGFVLLVINDGSTDATRDILEKLEREFRPRLEVIHQENVGHGQTCLRGYRSACERRIPFALQIDSDGQCDSRDFSRFWKSRDSFDVIYGVRRKREDGWRRVLASRILQFMLLLRAHVRCADANVPFRLMKIKQLQKKLEQIPASFCLANIALAVLLRRDPDIRHGEFSIRFRARYGGEPSVPLARFLIKACQLFRQLAWLPKQGGSQPRDNADIIPDMPELGQ